MKKLFILLGILYAGVANGQVGFFLQPQIGGGFSNTNIRRPVDPMAFGISLSENVLTYNPQLILGYAHSFWAVRIGASYLETGFSGVRETFYGPYTPITKSLTEYYAHYMVPVTFALRGRIGYRWLFSPEAGGAVSYNYGKYGTYTFASNKYTETVMGKAFTQNYQQYSYWAIGKINFEFELSQRINLLWGVSGQYMINSMLKDKTNIQKGYAYTLNMGMIWDLKHDRPKKPLYAPRPIPKGTQPHG